MFCVGPEQSASTPRKHVIGLPDYGWRVPMSYKCNVKCSPFAKPRVNQIPQYVGLGLRYAKYWIAKKRQGRRPFIDHLNQMKHKPIYGCPLGGIGSGSIGRGYRGEFCRFQMVPGMYHYHIIDANQFIVSISQDGQTVYQKVLSCAQTKRHGRLKEWDWSFPPENGLYHALYPRAWSVFNIPEHKITLICRQVSPVLPHDYLETSLPSAAFVWKVLNESSMDLEVSITFTFKNGQGTKEDRGGGVWCQDFNLDIDGDAGAKGVAIHQEFNGMKCSYGIAAKQTEKVAVSILTQFDPNGSGTEVWKSLLDNGKLMGYTSLTPSPPTSRGQEIASAVCGSQMIKKNSEETFEFSLSWDMPKIQFAAKENTYTRRYAQLFGLNGDAAPQLCSYTLRNYALWEEKIELWQSPVLNSGYLPAWYKSAIFNELYFLSDGGSIWIEATKSCKFSQHPTVKEFGRFAYLEGQEYRMFNTYDVHHYSSFALLMLWPKLQLSLQYDYGDTVTMEDRERVKFLMAGESGIRKVANCVPHDIGDPEDEPWIRINAYNIHPTDDWKDLNIKFILQVYRDYAATGDKDYLDFMYPKCQVLLESAKAWDTDGDGIIDNGGYADQTFDAWVMKGASSYCGGMWLVALRMMVAMASDLGRTDEQVEYQAMLDKGKESFESKLWNGSYYNYDSSTSGYHDSIMADQLAGQWFLKASGLPDESVFPADHVRSALMTIYQNNVLGFQNGHMGAINGTRPDGTMDLTSPQSEEFWTGVTYALGATMIQEGLVEEGFKTAYGAYHTCWDVLGLHFQTPEAYTANQGYRSLAYMRPLAIWAIQWAVEKFQPQLMQAETTQVAAYDKGFKDQPMLSPDQGNAIASVEESCISTNQNNSIQTQADLSTIAITKPVSDNSNDEFQQTNDFSASNLGAIGNDKVSSPALCIENTDSVCLQSNIPNTKLQDNVEESVANISLHPQPVNNHQEENAELKVGN